MHLLTSSTTERIVIELSDSSSSSSSDNDDDDDDPHHQSCSSLDTLSTGNATDEESIGVPVTTAPSFSTPTAMAMGPIVLDDDTPTPTQKNIQQWVSEYDSSPAMNTRKRKSQVALPTIQKSPTHLTSTKRTRRSYTRKQAPPAQPHMQVGPARSNLDNPAVPGAHTSAENAPHEEPGAAGDPAPYLAPHPPFLRPGPHPTVEWGNPSWRAPNTRPPAPDTVPQVYTEAPADDEDDEDDDDDDVLPNVNLPTLSTPSVHAKHRSQFQAGALRQGGPPAPVNPPPLTHPDKKKIMFGGQPEDSEEDEDDFLDIIRETKVRPDPTPFKPHPAPHPKPHNKGTLQAPVDVFSLFSQSKMSITPMTAPIKKLSSPVLSDPTPLSPTLNLVLDTETPNISKISEESSKAPTSPASNPPSPSFRTFSPPPAKKSMDTLTLSLVLHSTSTSSQVLDTIELEPDESFEHGVQKYQASHSLELSSDWVLAYQNTKVSKHCTPRIMGFNVFVTLDLFLSEAEFELSQKSLPSDTKQEEENMIRLVLKDASNNFIKLKLNPNKDLRAALVAFQTKFNISQEIQARGPEGDILDASLSCEALGLEDEDMLHINLL